MIENFQEFGDGIQTALNISETLLKSREVVNQSKNLISKINSINQSSISQSKILKIKSLDQSSFETSQRSPTLRGHDIESFYQKENLGLKDKISSLEIENSLLRLKLREKDSQILKLSQILEGNGFNMQKILTEKNKKEYSVNSKVNLKFSFDEKLLEKERLEKKLENISNEYNEQVSINLKLKEQIEEYLQSNNYKRIAELEGKIKKSHENLKFLSKRLEKTEAILSRNVTPTRLEICGSFTSGPKIKKKKKSCAVVSYKSKKV